MKSTATHHRIHQMKIIPLWTHQNFSSNNNNNNTQILCFCLKFKKEKNTRKPKLGFLKRKKTKSYLKKGINVSKDEKDKVQVSRTQKKKKKERVFFPPSLGESASRIWHEAYTKVVIKQKKINNIASEFFFFWVFLLLKPSPEIRKIKLATYHIKIFENWKILMNENLK